MSAPGFDPTVLKDDDRFTAFGNSAELQSLVSHWSHCCKTNNHSEVVSSLNNIRAITNKIASESIHNDTIKQFYLSFLETSNIKMVYRCLNQKKNNTTVPMINILHNLISYRLVNDFINSFDMASNILPNLLIKNDPIRTNFISFWIHLNGAMNYFDRMNHLSSKVWTNIFKHLADDSQESVENLVAFLESKVIDEVSFKRSTKLKLFNETCLFNLQANLDKFKLLPLFKKIIDNKTGILFLEAPNTTISVSGKTYKINNKVIYNLLTFVKLDSVNKINLVQLILSKDYNLIDPYMNHLLVNGGYNDPNLTTWYFSHTLLYTKILKLPTYELSHIILKPVSKSALTKGLKYNLDLVVQLNLELILLILEKLQHIENRSLINNILRNLPDLNDMIIQSDKESTNILVLKILKIYSTYQASMLSNLTKYLNDSLSKVLLNFDELNLIKLNYIVSTQLNLSTKFELKQNSLVIKLVSFFEADKNIQFFYDLLNKLVTIPNVSLLNPLYVLLKLELPDDLSNSLSELFTRYNNPYKYVDMPYKVNVFIKILVEQFIIFMKKNSNKHSQWFESLLVHFCILGESQSELMRLVDLLGFKCSPNFDKVDQVNIIKNDFEFLVVLYIIKRSQEEQVILEQFDKLNNYLVSNSSFVNNFNNIEFFELFLTLYEFKLKCFNDMIKGLGDIFDNKIKDLVFDAMRSDEKIRILNWILSSLQLNYSEFDEETRLANCKVLISRGVIPDIQVSDLFGFKSEEKYSIIRHKLNPSNISSFISQIVATKKYDLLKDVELDQELVEYLCKLDPSKNDLCTIGSIIYSKIDLSTFYQNVDLSKNELPFTQYLQLVFNCLNYKSFPENITETLIELAPNYSDTFCIPFVEIILKMKSVDKKWLSNSMIYITKQFAELPELSDDFSEFLNAYIKLLPLDIPINIIETQLEVLLGSKYVRSDFLRYMNSVILSTKKIDSGKLLTIFVNNPNNILNGLPNAEDSLLRIQSSLIIYNLFNNGADHKILKHLIHWYNGSLFFEDLIIKKILIKIETLENKPWINNKWNWEINEFKENDFDLIGKQPLFSNNLIALNKNFIVNTLSFKEKLTLPDNYVDMVSYINENHYILDCDYFSTVYDFEFLGLLIINNEEFFKFEEEGVLINFKNLIEYNILELIVENYHNPTAKILLNSLVKNIDKDTSFKDKNLFKIYLSNILNSPELETVQLHFYAKFIPILNNPGHFLYELVFKYVLSHPKIKSKELPMFSTVKELSLKTIEWYISSLKIVDSDLQILNGNQFFEWMLNLLNLPAKLNERLQSSILKLIFDLPELNYGSISLITRHGILSYLEMISISKPQWKNNLSKIAEKLQISGSKRTLEWSNYDLVNTSKRVKL